MLESKLKLARASAAHGYCLQCVLNRIPVGSRSPQRYDVERRSERWNLYPLTCRGGRRNSGRARIGHTGESWNLFLHLVAGQPYHCNGIWIWFAFYHPQCRVYIRKTGRRDFPVENENLTNFLPSVPPYCGHSQRIMHFVELCSGSHFVTTSKLLVPSWPLNNTGTHTIHSLKLDSLSHCRGRSLHYTPYSHCNHGSNFFWAVWPWLRGFDCWLHHISAVYPWLHSTFSPLTQ